MPYEQAVNGDLVDGRSDLFALGATLYHLLTGRVPFEGDTHEEIVREKAQDAYQTARDYRADVPPELDRILARTLACDPRSRFQSAAELVAELTATGLALDGPMWSPSPESLPGADGQPGSDGATRTRADLPLFGQPDLLASPPPLPVARPPRPSESAIRPVGMPTGRPPHIRLFGWSLVAITFAAGLLGLASGRSVCRDRQPEPVQPPTQPLDATAKAPGSHPAGESQ
jgi:serine/threonine-protein kinase